MNRVGLWVGASLTLFYLLFILYFLGGAAWCLVREGKLNEMGGFLAGAFTPLAFLWLVLGYLMQHMELSRLRQRDEVAYQRSVPRLEFQLVTAKQEVKRGVNLEKIFEGDRWVIPFDWEISDWEIENFGGTVRQLTLLFDDKDSLKKRRVEMRRELGPHGNQIFKFAIIPPGPAGVDHYEAHFTSARLDRFRQRWEIQRAKGDLSSESEEIMWERGKTKGAPPFEIREITDGPTPLEEG